MFLVINKQKLFSYFVAFTTVIVLLGMAKIYTNKSAEIVETFSKAREENIQKKAEIAEEKNYVKNNSIVISNEWKDKDINELLSLLKKYNINMKFYLQKEWKSKHNASVNQIANCGHEIHELDNDKANE